MKKRAVEVWVGYLMYLLFAILTLSIVLYSVDNYMKGRQSEMIVKASVNSLIQIKDTLDNVLSCTSCIINQKYYVPEGCLVKIGEFTDVSGSNQYIFANYTCLLYKNVSDIDTPNYISIHTIDKYPGYVNISLKQYIPSSISSIDTTQFNGKISKNYVCINISKIKDPSTGAVVLYISDGSC